MGHPLPVARFRRGAHATPDDVRKVHREAGVPPAPSLCTCTRQVSHIFHRRTKTGGTHHRAIGTTQTARGHVFPARVVEIAIEQVLDVSGIHAAAHLRGGVGKHILGTLDIILVSLAIRYSIENFNTQFAANFYHKVVLLLVQNFRQRQVKAALGLWTGLHRHTKARTSCLSAVNSNNAEMCAPLTVNRVVMLQEDAVLDSNSVQLAWAHSNKGKFGRFLLVFGYTKSGICAVGLP